MTDFGPDFMDSTMPTPAEQSGEAKFTPGPWKVEDYGHPLSITTDGLIIARVTYELPLTDEDEANARLIAAAPVMHDALQSILRFVETMPSAAARAVEMTCKSALAKAEGRS